MNRNAFILSDSLLCVLLSSMICLLSYSLVRIDSFYQQYHEDYQKLSNEIYAGIFSYDGECDVCADVGE